MRRLAEIAFNKSDNFCFYGDPPVISAGVTNLGVLFDTNSK